MTILFYKENEMSPTLGGISKINCSLQTALIKRGFSCYFLSSNYNKQIAPNSGQVWLPDLNVEFCNENVAWLHDFIIDNHVDIIINNCFRCASVHLLDDARQGTNCKIITWIHNNIVEYGSLFGYRKERILRKKHLNLIYYLITRRPVIYIFRYLTKMKYKKIARECYNRSNNIVTVCKGNIPEFLFLLGKSESDKVVAIPNFIPNLSKCEDVIKKDIVVWCGTVDFDLKKTNWMIDIWKNIQPSHPDWYLYILGDSCYLKELKEYANSVDAQNITFTGRVNPSGYYENASVICSTSITESFGLTIAEGMQNGLVPVSFSASAAIRELVEENGLLVKPFDIKQYCNVLSGLLSNKNLRESLSKRCMSSARKYEEEIVIDLWVDLFNQR